MSGVTQKLHSNQEYKKIVYFIALIAALGGLLFGLDQGFIANSLKTISITYNLETTQQESFSGVLATGGVLGALLSGFFARFLGRKKTIVLAGFLFTIASLISALLPSYWLLHLCRAGLGFAVGIASFTVPLYLSETSPKSLRGKFGSYFQLMLVIGIMSIAYINVAIVKFFGETAQSMVIMYGVLTLFSLIMFLGAFILPESPRWLILKGKEEEAYKVLQKISVSKEEIDEGIKEIEEAAQVKVASFEMLSKGFFWKVLLIGIASQMFQQLVGINVMIYYGPQILGDAGFTGLLGELFIPTINLLATFIAIKYIDKLGRRTLLYIGATIMLITMLVAGICFYIINAEPEASHSLVKILLVISLGLYIVGFASSWGPVIWVFCSEIFPLKGREIGMTITTMVNWTFASLVISNALSFMKIYGQANLFFLFAAFCVGCLVFLKLFIPETKGVSLEKIESDLEKGIKLNKIGNN